MRRPVIAGLPLLLFFLAGCGTGRSPVYPVEGKVFDDKGKPAVGARVILHPLINPEGDFNRPVGTVDDTGTFRLTTFEKGDGAPAGEYSVSIEWRPPRRSPVDPPPPDQLKGRYSNPKTTPFKATVAKQATTLEPFTVK
ncbi:MAG: carboxypeptidase-like regulatory domain-containing protein [Candidatus Acidiferrum sp.]